MPFDRGGLDLPDGGPLVRRRLDLVEGAFALDPRRNSFREHRGRVRRFFSALHGADVFLHRARIRVPARG